jgi:dihydrofolate reductase
MNITLAMVSSINGKITNGSDSNIYTWTSKEDAAHFFSLIKKYTLIVMGSRTYESAKDKISLHPDVLRVVMTHDPKKYIKERIPTQLEFTSETPKALVQRLTSMGYKELLLVGGGKINASFFQEKLINTLLLTIEPKIFASGNDFVSGMDQLINLNLTQVKKLNSKGTLLLTYEVLP